MSASVISLLCGVGEGWEFRSRTALGTKVTFLLWDLQLDSGVTQTMKTTRDGSRRILQAIFKVC